MKKVSRQMRKMEAADKPEMTLGLDMGDRYSHYCLLNADGDVVEEGRMQSTEAALRRHFEGEPPPPLRLGMRHSFTLGQPVAHRARPPGHRGQRPQDSGHHRL